MQNDILRRAQKHFFAAMLNGWAAGVEGSPVRGMPGFKDTMYAQDDFHVRDLYCAYPSGKSEGTTKIWCRDEPVWVMTYGGFYRKGDIPFLKHALMFAYRDRSFNGCRGPMLYLEEENTNTARYINHVESGSSFENFRGTEAIRDASGKLLGWHHYWGMALI